MMLHNNVDLVGHQDLQIRRDYWKCGKLTWMALWKVHGLRQSARNTLPSLERKHGPNVGRSEKRFFSSDCSAQICFKNISAAVLLPLHDDKRRHSTASKHYTLRCPSWMETWWKLLMRCEENDLVLLCACSTTSLLRKTHIYRSLLSTNTKLNKPQNENNLTIVPSVFSLLSYSYSQFEYIWEFMSHSHHI